MPVTSEQLQQLQELVSQVVSDKSAADQATAASNKADTALASATSTANQAKLDESQADAKLTGDLSALATFINGLTVHTEPSNP